MMKPSKLGCVVKNTFSSWYSFHLQRLFQLPLAQKLNERSNFSPLLKKLRTSIFCWHLLPKLLWLDFNTKLQFGDRSSCCCFENSSQMVLVTIWLIPNLKWSELNWTSFKIKETTCGIKLTSMRSIIDWTNKKIWRSDYKRALFVKYK